MKRDGFFFIKKDHGFREGQCIGVYNKDSDQSCALIVTTVIDNNVFRTVPYSKDKFDKLDTEDLGAWLVSY